jgi:hypothetical protein
MTADGTHCPLCWTDWMKSPLVRCLGDIGPPAAAAAPALRQAVTSELRQIESGSPASWVADDEEWVRDTDDRARTILVPTGASWSRYGSLTSPRLCPGRSPTSRTRCTGPTRT